MATTHPDNSVMIVLREATGVPLSLTTPSEVLTAFGGKTNDGQAILVPLKKTYLRGKPLTVPAKDAEALLALRTKVALDGGGAVEIALFEVVTTDSAFQQLTPQDKMEALYQATLKQKAVDAGISVEDMELAVREEALGAAPVPEATEPSADEAEPAKRGPGRPRKTAANSPEAVTNEVAPAAE
jgi:hypothetical protein